MTNDKAPSEHAQRIREMRFQETILALWKDNPMDRQRLIEQLKTLEREQ
jgi:hypothetical protein